LKLPTTGDAHMREFPCSGELLALCAQAVFQRNVPSAFQTASTEWRAAMISFLPS